MNTPANLTPIARQRVAPLAADFVRPVDLARELGKSPHTVRAWIDKGYIRCSFLKKRRKRGKLVPTRFLIPRAEVERVKLYGPVPAQRELPLASDESPPPAAEAQVA